MKIEKELYDRILSKVGELQISNYHKMLLASMVYRKIKYPNERTNEVLQEASESIIPELYEEQKGKVWMRMSETREIEGLEEVLHDCENLPDEELTRGYIVSNMVNYYAKRFKKED